jgi:hypothetical protein
MKRFRTFCLAILFISAGPLSAQTADQVIEKHITAIGGRDVLDKIKTQVIESDLSVMGSDLTSVSTLQVGLGYKNVANFNGQDIIQVITTTGGWMLNPLAGQTDPQPLPDDQVKAGQGALSIASELYNYAAKGLKVELVGKEKLEGVDTYKIKLVKKDGTNSFFYLDAEKYYILKRESVQKVNGEDFTTSAIFSDYRKTDSGLVMAFNTINNQGFEITIIIRKVQFNVPVDPKIFEMPK